MNDVLTIGITGGIGSGKSYVAKMLAERFGIPVYDCDRALPTTSLPTPNMPEK